MPRRNRFNDASGETAHRPSAGRRAASRPRRRAGAANTVRIIGGEWRGRRLRFPDVTGLRPTPDRVRETLFNWLTPVIGGARCLDLFAGSGALGFEALSRGAASVTLVERDRAAARALRSAAADLGAGGRAEIIECGAPAYLAGATRPFDVIFLDPPFDAHALPATIATLARRGLARRGGCLYLEAPTDEALPALPPGWRLHRSGRAGEVGYHLVVCSGAPAGGEGTGVAPG
jgi:16S rRNA (guanine966-N2)-methyltransferase